MSVNIAIVCPLFIILLVLTNSATFNLKSTTNCVTTNANGFCTSWSQSGTIDEQTSACFAGDTLIRTKTGFKMIKNIQIGDFIYTIQNGQQQFTQVKGWLHKDQSKVSQYLNVTVNKGWFLVSKKHNIALLNEQTGNYYFDFAQELFKNKKLYNSLENENLQITTAKGMYSPITSTFTYLVYPSENSQPILAHNFANIRNPQFYELMVNMILKTSQFLVGDVSGADGIHVGAKWMMENFQFLMQ